MALRHLCLILLLLGDLSLGSNSGQGCFPTLFGSNHNSLTWVPSPPPHPLPGAIILHQMVPAGARLALGRGTTPPASSPSAHGFLLPWQGFLDHRHRPEVTCLNREVWCRECGLGVCILLFYHLLALGASLTPSQSYLLPLLYDSYSPGAVRGCDPGTLKSRDLFPSLSPGGLPSAWGKAVAPPGCCVCRTTGAKLARIFFLH